MLRMFLALALSVFVAGSVFAKPVEMRQGDLAKANALGQLAAEATKAASVADTASRIGIILEGPAARGASAGDRGSVVLMPTDPEWKTLVDAVKAVAARRQSKAETDLGALNIKILPDDGAKTEAAPKTEETQEQDTPKRPKPAQPETERD